MLFRSLHVKFKLLLLTLLGVLVSANASAALTGGTCMTGVAPYHRNVNCYGGNNSGNDYIAVLAYSFRCIRHNPLPTVGTPYQAVYLGNTSGVTAYLPQTLSSGCQDGVWTWGGKNLVHWQPVLGLPDEEVYWPSETRIFGCPL